MHTYRSLTVYQWEVQSFIQVTVLNEKQNWIFVLSLETLTYSNTVIYSGKTTILSMEYGTIFEVI